MKSNWNISLAGMLWQLVVLYIFGNKEVFSWLLPYM
jgi:hypothetical protein